MQHINNLLQKRPIETNSQAKIKPPSDNFLYAPQRKTRGQNKCDHFTNADMKHKQNESNKFNRAGNEIIYSKPRLEKFRETPIPS